MSIQKPIFLSGIALGMLLSVQAPAIANDRYASRPPVIISPDLSAPWVMQLENQNAVQQRQIQQRAATGFSLRLSTRPSIATQRSGVQQAAIRSNSAARQSAQQSAKPSMDPKYLPQMVNYETSAAPGSIIIDTNTKFLYLVTGDGKARRYGVGVGKEGFEWTGTETITRKAEWPSWRPPAQMIEREKKKGIILPTYMEGGPKNPLGARALYLGSTLYRIHGTNQPWTIGQAVSSGCIRMRNQDVVDLYERAKIGASVTVI